MPHLGLDLDRARELQRNLRAWAAVAATAEQQVQQAAVLADLPTSTPVRLNWIERCAEAAAGAIGTAVDTAQAFSLPPVTSVGVPPTAVVDRRWSDLRQVADHNTYVHGTVDEQRALGRHAHEFDLHVGAPTDLRGGDGVVGPPWLDLAQLIVDAIRDDHVQPGDWHVYHTSFDPASAYASLGAALDDVAASTGPVPVTIFLDVKDPLDGSHAPAALDALLRERLGDRLWSPGDLLARAPGEADLQTAVDRAGWPRVGELDGRVMVVLTAEVDAYRSQPVAASAAFVGVAPDLGALVDPNIVVYNAHASRIDAGELATIRSHDGLVRVWGASHPEQSAVTRAANWVAID